MTNSTNIRFSPFTKNHIRLYKQWMKHPALHKWYHPDSTDVLIQKILTTTDITPLLICNNTTFIGYAQWYWTSYDPWWQQPPHTIGIDLFIEYHQQNKGIGVCVISSLISFLVNNNAHVSAIVADPYMNNYAARKAFKKASLT